MNLKKITEYFKNRKYRKYAGHAENIMDKISGGRRLSTALAAVVEVAYDLYYADEWDMPPRKEQIAAAAAMLDGYSVDVATGEGKTLVITLYAIAQALRGKKVHIVTANSYLAHRDKDWMYPLYEALGVSVSALPETGAIGTGNAREIYSASVIYGTAAGFGFDYLRENGITQDRDQLCIGKQDCCVVDEADSVLIDDAVSPLILGGMDQGFNAGLYSLLNNKITHLVDEQANALTMLYGVLRSDDQEAKLRAAWLIKHAKKYDRTLAEVFKADIKFAKEYENFEGQLKLPTRQELCVELNNGLLYNIDGNSVCLTKWGEKYINDDADAFMLTGDGSHDDLLKANILCVIQNLLEAHVLYERNADYIVKDGQALIVDKNTGRALQGRKWRDGLHQAIEAKEGLGVSQRNVTYAKITLQQYFKKYNTLVGLSGTLSWAAEELNRIYGLRILSIPTHKPNHCITHPDRLFNSTYDKFQYILGVCGKMRALGRPVLIGGSNIELANELQKFLNSKGMDAQRIDATNAECEAKVISCAGEPGVITIATNMAGRGTDIKLAPQSIAAGGLYVIGLEHDILRVDAQLAGRCARHGEPGDVEFLNSPTDRLIVSLGNPSLWAHLACKATEGEIAGCATKLLMRILRRCQQKREIEDFSARFYLYRMDKVTEEIRSEYYALRRYIMDTPKEYMSKVCKDVKYAGTSKELAVAILSITDAYYVRLLEYLEEAEEGARLSGYGGRLPVDDYTEAAAMLYSTMNDNIRKTLSERFCK